MLARVFSGATVGLESVLIEVEVDVAKKGFPGLMIVGLPNKAIEEAKERVRSAIKNTGLKFPDGRITINLAPADLPKQGPAYDLPMALGLLMASGQIEKESVGRAMVLGELSLDGSLRHTNGILPMAIMAKEKKLEQIFLPEIDASEAAIVSGIKVIALRSLKSLFNHLTGLQKIQPQPLISFSQLLTEAVHEFDMKEIKGQEQAKRALEICASGGHNLLMVGLPGAGKTLLARTLPSILPALTENEALEVTKIYSISGRLASGESIVKVRPFRSPHHTSSRIGLIGGGSQPKPGEISLAHRGVLFLDEFPEFPRGVLEALRQPLEDAVVTVSRAKGQAQFPAQFILVAAANPCPCGHLGDPKKECQCSSSQISRYQKRVSGPIIDRIDLHLEVPAVQVEKLVSESQAESSSVIRKRVQKARDRQIKRLEKTGLVCNAEMTNRQVKELCPLTTDCLRLLHQAANQLGLSARGYYKIIKIARTIADLAGEQDITTDYLAEALQYRPKESI